MFVDEFVTGVGSLNKSSSYDSSDEEFDLQEEEDLALVLAMRADKRSKHDGSVFG